MLIGYARVSTDQQSLDLQIDALTQAGCTKIFTDKVSGAKSDRPGLTSALEFLRPNDSLVIWRLDRLGRSLKDLIQIAEELKESQIGLVSLQESINTQTAGGQLIFHLFGALAEFERNLIRERVSAGLESSRKRGIKGGRRYALPESKQELVAKTYHSQAYSMQEIADMFSISIPTVYKYARKYAVEA